MDEKIEGRTQVYRIRFLMLGLFVLYSMMNAFHWIEYSIIANIVSKYYHVSELTISLTSMTYSIFYIPLILPANWVLEKKGLRFAVLVGCFGTCLGSWIKCGSLARTAFPITMVGQSIVAASQVFILGIPAQLAGVWFSAEEVSRACAVGVFGNQLGIALGFVLPPLIVPNSENEDDIRHGLSILFYGVAGVTSVLFVAILLLFQARPPLPPSKAQAALLNPESHVGYWTSIWNLAKHLHFMMLLITYGINVGIFYAISTFLNPMVLDYYPGATEFGRQIQRGDNRNQEEKKLPQNIVSHLRDYQLKSYVLTKLLNGAKYLVFLTGAEESAGWMGLTIVICGMFGSVACGFILDKTHRFKETTLGVYILSLCGMISFAVVLRYGSLAWLFVIAAFLGFFMTGYLPLGFEFAAEITYPEAEAVSSGLLNASAQLFGIIFTSATGALLEAYGDLNSNICLIVSLSIGAIITAFIKSDLRRLKASQLPSSVCDKLNP